MEIEEPNRFAALQTETDNNNDEPVFNPINNTTNVTTFPVARHSRGISNENNDVPSPDSEMDDDSSQASEFVDATQRLDTDMQFINHETPERVQQDMQFLNESWANLADTDEDQIRLQQQALNASIAAEADIDKLHTLTN